MLRIWGQDHAELQFGQYVDADPARSKKGLNRVRRERVDRSQCDRRCKVQWLQPPVPHDVSWDSTQVLMPYNIIRIKRWKHTIISGSSLSRHSVRNEGRFVFFSQDVSEKFYNKLSIRRYKIIQTTSNIVTQHTREELARLSRSLRAEQVRNLSDREGRKPAITLPIFCTDRYRMPSTDSDIWRGQWVMLRDYTTDDKTSNCTYHISLIF